MHNLDANYRPTNCKEMVLNMFSNYNTYRKMVGEILYVQTV
jgi:hypothetical protein